MRSPVRKGTVPSLATSTPSNLTKMSSGLRKEDEGAAQGEKSVDSIGNYLLGEKEGQMPSFHELPRLHY